MTSEKRLIDAEALKAAIERYADVEETKSIIETGGSIMSWEHRQVLQSIAALMCAIKIVDECPTVDAVDVVRCKNCKFWEPHHYKHRTDGLCLCLSKYHDAERPMTEADYYCAYGERKER